MSYTSPPPADTPPPGYPSPAQPASPPPGTEPVPAAARSVPFWRTPFSRRTWAEALYGLIGLPLACVGFSLAVTGFALGLSLLVTVIGVFVFGFAIVLGRWIGSLERGLLNSLLGERIRKPRPFRSHRTGFFGWAVSRLGDPVGWRGLAFAVIKLPLSILSFTITVTFWAITLAGLTYWAWWRYLPAQLGSDGKMHRGASLFNTQTHSYFLDTPQRIVPTIAVGIVFLWLTPWLVRGFVGLERLLGRGLLGPVSVSQRVRELEQSRTEAVSASNEQLRRIERDLHDGTQARLVALAMNLGQAKEDLASADPAVAERARTLIDGAHQQAKETLVELRDLARGIHPPILDNGLESALTSLGSRCPIRVSLAVDLPERPSATSETIAYFAVAELLTNAVKHSRASQIDVRLHPAGDQLVFTVSDDGRGGAVLGAGSGLAGVERRLGTVDGTLEVESPLGGPTAVTGSLPMRA